MKSNIERFPSKQMYPYLSLVGRKVVEFYHHIDGRCYLVWLKWLIFIAFSGQFLVSLKETTPKFILNACQLTKSSFAAKLSPFFCTSASSSARTTWMQHCNRVDFFLRESQPPLSPSPAGPGPQPSPPSRPSLAPLCWWNVPEGTQQGVIFTSTTGALVAIAVIAV